MTTRRSGTVPRRTAAGVFGLALALGAGGCASFKTFSPGSSDPGRQEAWLGYLSGADLRAECEVSGLDAFRLVWRPPGGGFRVLEVLGNEAGGALMLHRAITPGDLAVARPPDTLPAAEQRLPLAPDAFGRLLSWFDRMGLLTPVPGAPGQPGEALEGLISGCLGGSRLFNVHLPAAGGGAGGALIKAGRGSAGRAASAA